jgi:hypothetical protein
VVVADPFPERCRSAERGVRDEIALIELARAEADRTDEQASPTVRELGEKLLERWATVTSDSLGVARQCETNGVLRQEHRYLPAALNSRAADKECHQDPLRIFETGGEIYHNLR